MVTVWATLGMYVLGKCLVCHKQSTANQVNPVLCMLCMLCMLCSLR